jgi:RES domain-containing protein
LALDVDAISIRGTWVRHGRSPSLPLPDRDPPPDARWQRGAIVDALYLADTEPTAWAEWYRHLAEVGVPPDQWLPTYLWSWRLDVEVANLSSEARLHRVGLSSPSPGRHTWLPFQQAGQDLFAEGWAGLIAPSAARPASLVLCLFRRGGSIPGATPVPPARKVTAAPTPPTGMTT